MSKEDWRNYTNIEEFVDEIEQEDLEFEKHLEQQIKDGYMLEDGTPLKCQCGCTILKQVTTNKLYGWGDVEYIMVCDECG